MKKSFLIVGTLALLLVSGCYNSVEDLQKDAEALKTDVQKSAENLKGEVIKVGEKVKETKEKVEDKIQKTENAYNAVKALTE